MHIMPRHIATLVAAALVPLPHLAAGTVCCCSGIVMLMMQCYDDPAHCLFASPAQCGASPPPPPQKPVLPKSWYGNITSVHHGGKTEHGWTVVADCASRVEMVSPTDNLTRIIVPEANATAQCTFGTNAPYNCSRTETPRSPCPWDLSHATYNGTAFFPRSCNGWRVESGAVYYVDWQNLPCGFVADGTRIAFQNVVAADPPKAVFKCPC